MMSPAIVRIVGFMVVALAAFNGLWWLAIPISVIVMSRFDAVEYIVLAWIIDVYYSPVAFTFWYTGMTIVAVLLLSWLRPYLRWRRYDAE